MFIGLCSGTARKFDRMRGVPHRQGLPGCGSCTRSRHISSVELRTRMLACHGHTPPECSGQEIKGGKPCGLLPAGGGMRLDYCGAPTSYGIGATCTLQIPAPPLVIRFARSEMKAVHVRRIKLGQAAGASNGRTVVPPRHRI